MFSLSFPSSEMGPIKMHVCWYNSDGRQGSFYLPGRFEVRTFARPLARRHLSANAAIITQEQKS